jgi:cellulose synthase/poly-beta-1,6-N-acetylglucosamine synthase-like glycosyltransferase
VERRRHDAAREAVGRLLRERPQASAKVALERGGRLAAAATVLLFVLALLAGHVLFAALGALAGAGFLALIAFRVAAVLTPPRAIARPGPSRLEPPVYSVLVPLHREADVVGDLAAALMALDYPRDRLDIKLICEADDLGTVAAAERLRLPSCFEILLVPPGSPRTKPRALNFALAFARGDFVVIYDAEDRPASGQLCAALDAFDAGDARLACVQAPLSWYNARETWLTRQFALEYAALFYVVLPALARWGWPFPLGGTSNHFRRAALDHAAGWDPYNVTEDADLGLRLAELGYRSTVIGMGTEEEAVTRLAPWTRQRSRWIKGFFQTLLVRMANLGALAAHAGPGGVASLLLTIALPLASSAVHGPAAVLTLVALLTGRLPPAAAAALLAGYAAAAASAWVGLMRSGQLRLAPAILLMPFYWPLHSIAACRAVWDLARPLGEDATRRDPARLRPRRRAAWERGGSDAASGPAARAPAALSRATAAHRR